jgi:hypothetical protein
MAAKHTRPIYKIAIQLHLVAVQFSLQVASPETFGYILVKGWALTVLVS